MAGALCPQERKRGANDMERAEHIDLEQPSHLRIGCLLDRAEQTIACIVDDDVDAARERKGLQHDRFGVVALGEIKRQDMQLPG